MWFGGALKLMLSNKRIKWESDSKATTKNDNNIYACVCLCVSDIQCAQYVIISRQPKFGSFNLDLWLWFRSHRKSMWLRRPAIRSTQINPFFPNDIAFFVLRSSFIHSFDQNNATIYLFPFKSSVLQPNKNDSYRFGQKGNRSCHDKKDPKFVSLVRAFVLIFHLAKICFFLSFAFCSAQALRELSWDEREWARVEDTQREREREKKASMALNECAMSGLFSQSKKRRFKSSRNEMKIEENEKWTHGEKAKQKTRKKKKKSKKRENSKPEDLKLYGQKLKLIRCAIYSVVSSLCIVVRGIYLQ